MNQTTQGASAQEKSAPVSDLAAGALPLGNPDPFWYGKSGQTAQGGYVDAGSRASASCFRWEGASRPGRWVVTLWVGGLFEFCQQFEAVVDDFGNLRKVGVLS